jgi:heme-degrading monooxygenase HmoA
MSDAVRSRPRLRPRPTRRNRDDPPVIHARDGADALCETARHGSRRLRLDHDAEAEARLARRVQPLRAYELYSPDGNEVVGVSVWDSAESRDAYRRSEVESERRSAMAPYVLEEVSGFYVGRELKIPRD